MVFKLVDPTLLSGTLVVDVPLEGVSIIIDGFLVGTTPLTGPFEEVPTGEHTLKLSAPSIEDYFSFFTIQHDKTTTVRVSPQQVATLQAEIQAAEVLLRTPLYKKWWFWTAIASGAFAVAGGVLAVRMNQDGNGPQEASLGTVSFR